jgi:hypothetical protein
VPQGHRTVPTDHQCVLRIHRTFVKISEKPLRVC